eukprot:superscaffoldBa00009746_g24286
MQLHFTKDVLPDSVSTDFQNLNKFNEQFPSSDTDPPVSSSGALKKNLTAEQIKEDLETLGLNEDKSAHFSQQWGEHYAVLSRLAVRQTLMVNQLVDMEWKFG